MLTDSDVFYITEKGVRALFSAATFPPGEGLVGDARHILPLFGNALTLAEVLGKLPPSMRCDASIKELLEAGYITRRSGERPEALHPIQPSAGTLPEAVSGQEDPTLDFTRKSPVFAGIIPDAIPLVSTDVLMEEIENRSQQLATEKFRLYEQEMSNSLAQMAGHELFQAEQEKLSRQQAMVDIARLSPIFETLRGLLFFKDFSEADMAEVLDIGVWREMKERDVLLRDGDRADSICVMMRGHASAFKRDRLIGLVQSGESFGESSLLVGDEEIHHADVVAMSPVEFMEFSTGKLEQTSIEVRLHFVTAFLRCQTRRLVCANEQIVNLLADSEKRD